MVRRSRPGPVDPNNLPPSSSPEFEDESEEWRANYTRGVDLWKTLQHSLQHPPDIRCPEPLQHWQTKLSTSDQFTKVFAKQCSENGLLNYLDSTYNTGASGVERICSDFFSRFWQTSNYGLPKNLPEDVSERFDFDNWYSPFARAIIAFDNVGRIDPKTGVPASQWYRAPNSWADVAFASWYEVSKDIGWSTSYLKFIAQTIVYNEPTVKIAEEIYADDDRGPAEDEDESEGGDKRRTAILEYQPTDSDFYALLSTPNGYGTAAILTKYASLFATRDENPPYSVTHVKTIEKITMAFEEDGPGVELGFTLIDVAPPAGFVAPPTITPLPKSEPPPLRLIRPGWPSPLPPPPSIGT